MRKRRRQNEYKTQRIGKNQLNHVINNLNENGINQNCSHRTANELGGGRPDQNSRMTTTTGGD